MPKEDIQNPPLDVEHELPQGEANEDAVSTEPTEFEKLKAENTQYLERLAQREDELARTKAEWANYKKRSEREQIEYKQYALGDALKQLLPILDSLDRALKTEGISAKDLHSGVELIDRQFHDVLTRLGVEPIPAQGQPFDPTQHQAIQMVETAEVPDHHVLEELQRGYRIRDRVLRPAMVRVAQKPN